MYKRNAIATAIALAFAGPALAQNAVNPANPQPGSAAPTLSPVIVTGNPLGSDLFNLAVPADSLEGQQLRLKMKSTLGETLNSEPGVSSTYFGPNASRPIIRGLDSERVRILQNGSSSLDASTLSFDHNVPIAPIAVDRIEVIRGPAAILYGGSAIGGVVNVIDNRIATERNAPGTTGAVDGQYGSNNANAEGAARLNFGADNGMNFHIDGFDRSNSNLRIPGSAHSARQQAADIAAGNSTGAVGFLPNTGVDAWGGGLGTSYVAPTGYAGVSYSRYRSNYGTPADENVRIGMDQERADFAGEKRDLSGPLQSVKVKVGYSNYQHTEFDSGVPSQKFTNRGFDARIEARHARLGPLDGVVGFQGTRYDFAVLGDDPTTVLVPTTHNSNYGVFVFEQAKSGAFTFQFGIRSERAKSDADAAANLAMPTSRSFTANSAAAGAIYELTKEYSLALNVTHTERAPAPAELFSNGPHDATASFEVGNPDIGKEKSNGVDLALRKRSGRVTGSVGVFYNKFQNFIALIPSGVIEPVSGSEIFNYVGVPATFKGGEAQGKIRLFDAGYQVDLRLMADYTRAQNDLLDQPLPRIPPLRAGAGIDYISGAFGASIDVLHAFDQDRNAANEFPTDGYTLVNAALTYLIKTSAQARLELYLKGVNLLNQEIRFSTSILKDIAPAGGRGVVAGARLTF